MYEKPRRGGSRGLLIDPVSTTALDRCADFPSEWAGTGLTSLKRKRRAFEDDIVQRPSLALQACCKRLPRRTTKRRISKCLMCTDGTCYSRV